MFLPYKAKPGLRVVYKKYRHYKGKKLGPYYYESVRQPDGTVKTIYLGTKLPKKAKPISRKLFALQKSEIFNRIQPRYFLILLIAIIVIGGFFFFAGSGGPLATGFATLPSGPGGCSYLTGLNETNISGNITLCAGTYYMNDTYNDGIVIENNGTLVIDTDYLELDCNGAIIIGNSDGYGIFMENRTNVTIRNCVIQSYERAINVYNTNNSEIIDNNIGDSLGTTTSGIYIRTSTELNISNNSVHDIAGDGITMLGLLGGMKPNSDNIFYNNSINSSTGDGLDLTVDENSTIYHNVIELNGMSGIYASGYNHSIYNNTIRNNTLKGINLEESNTTIFENNISGNTGSGVSVTANNNTIYNNTITENNEGIYVIVANFIDIYNNTINLSSAESIYLSDSTNCNVSNNTLLNGTYGIRVAGVSLSNNIISNNATGNTVRGISIESGLNLIYDNYMSENLIPVQDSAAGNNWTSENQTGTNIIGGSIIAGNYYDNYSGNDTDGDYIGDTAYVVEGNGASDNYPLWYPTPVITATLVYPTATGNVTQDVPFNYTLNVSCTNANCGNINVSLDPIGGGGTFDLDFIEANAYATIETRFYTNDGDGTYTFNSNIFTDDRTYAIGAGDMDNDGDLDLVIGRDNAADWTYLNNGSGTFALNATSTLTEQTTDIAFADFTNDGAMDYISASYNEENRVFINNGKGTFVLTSNTTEETSTYDIAVGDFDNDGDMDLLEGNNNDTGRLGYNRIYMNDGAGTFTLTWNSSEEDDTWSVGVADLDNDGDLDFIVGNYNDSTEPGNNRVYLNNGSGSFKTGWNSTETDNTYAIALGDLNNDGFVDFIAGNGQWSTNTASRVYLNNGDATFNLSWNSSDIDNVRDIEIGDLDNDGDLDFLTGSTANVTRAYMNSGTGLVWTPVWNSTNADKTTRLVLGDFNGDGDATELNCSDGLDNDLDVWIDNQDPDCKALISTTENASPFWTNKSTNPFTVNLDKDESQNITFWVTPNGVINGVYEFFAYANQTADSTISGETTHINLTIRQEPTVRLLSPASGTSITGGQQQEFSCNIESTDVTTNLTFYIWDSSGGLKYSDTQQLTGPDVGARWNYTLPTEDNDATYNWNCKGYAGTSYITEYVWSNIGNYTLSLVGVPGSSGESDEASTFWGGGTVGSYTFEDVETIWDEYSALQDAEEAEAAALAALEGGEAAPGGGTYSAPVTFYGRTHTTIGITIDVPVFYPGFDPMYDTTAYPPDYVIPEDAALEEAAALERTTLAAEYALPMGWLPGDIPPEGYIHPPIWMTQYELPEYYSLPWGWRPGDPLPPGYMIPEEVKKEVAVAQGHTTKVEEHELRIIYFNKDHLLLGISSDYWELIIEKGETENADLNQDGDPDLAITYDGMKADMAKMTFKKILRPGAEPEEEVEGEFAKPLFEAYGENEIADVLRAEEEKKKKEPKGESLISSKKFKIAISIFVLGFITVVQVIIFVNRRKKRSGGGGGAPAPAPAAV